MMRIKELLPFDVEEANAGSSVEEQLAKAEADLTLMRLQFGLVTGNVDEDPRHYENLNLRSAEIAHQHKLCVELRLQLGKLASR